MNSAQFALSIGLVDVSEFSITRLLERNIPTGLVLFPGAQNEYGLNETGSNKFQIYASRKGFVRVALKTGYEHIDACTFFSQQTWTVQLNWCCMLQSFSSSRARIRRYGIARKKTYMYTELF